MKRIALVVLLVAWTAGMAPESHAASPTVEKHVAVLMVNFTKQPSEPWTKQFVQGVYFGAQGSVAAYYAELSAGQIAITGDVFGYLTIKARRDECRFDDWGAAARTAAAAAGIDLASYTNVVYVFPYQPVCWWNGRSATSSAGQPVRDSWINGLLTLYVAVHELGHNLGLDHAGTLTCTQDGMRVAYSSNCSLYVYGDPNDIMGYGGHRLFQAWHRWQLGLLPDSDVQTITTDGTYTLSAAEEPGDAPRVLRIRRSNGDYYYLELRKPFGEFDDFGSNATAVTGVTIRIASEDPTKVTKLIDTTPETCTFNDAPLDAGRTFHDPINHIAVTTLSVGGGDATVEINFGSNAAEPAAPVFPRRLNAASPGAPGNVTVTQVTGQLVAVSWNAAASDAGVDHYVVTADGIDVGETCDLRLRNVPLDDGQTYEIGVQAVDTNGEVGPTETVSYTVPDFTSPNLPWRMSAAVSGSTVNLSWKRATDNVGVVSYRVIRDGKAIAEVSSDTTTYSDQSVPSGTHRYKVVAFDTAGNASAPAKKRVTVY